MKKKNLKKQVKIARKSLKANIHIGLADYLFRVIPGNTAPKGKLAKTIKKESAQLAKKIAQFISAKQVLLTAEASKAAVEPTEVLSDTASENKAPAKAKTKKALKA